MFDFMSLVRGAPTIPRAEDSGRETVANAIKAALRRQLDVPTQRPFRYPSEGTSLGSLKLGLEALPPELVVLGCKMLLEPQLVAAMSEPQKSDGIVRRELALFSVGRDSTHQPRAVWIALRAASDGNGRFARTTSVDADVRALDTNEVVDAMEDLFLQATPATRATFIDDAPRAMWLGGDVEDGSLPPEGEEQIRAALAVRGYRSEVVRRPLRSWRTVKQRLDNQPTALALIWIPYATPAPYHEIAANRFAVLEIDEPDFSDALMLGRLLLDDLERRSVPRPQDWGAFARRITDLECDAFVITPNARESIKVTGYPHPERMWDHLEALARAASAYRASGGVVGHRLADWIAEIAGIEVALHDDNLSEGEKRFTHDGVEHSREPHVKVDDAKPWIEVGRIYFAVDSDGVRFIIDHIGGKLY